MSTTNIPHPLIPKQATILKVAAVIVAAPRYFGAFGVSIGLDVLAEYPLLQHFEVASGAAMAVLEGFALAFVLSRWRLLKPGSTHWYVLLTMVLALALTLPVIGLPYLLTEQNGLHVSALFSSLPLLQVLWAVCVLAVPVIIVMAVGFADLDENERKQVQAKQRAVAKQIEQQSRANGQHRCSCGKTFGSIKALAGHQAHCSLKQNGKALEVQPRKTTST